MPSKKHAGAFVLVLLSVIVLSACTKGYDQGTGTYEDKGISVNFPSGWAKTTAVPNAAITIEQGDKNTFLSLFIQNQPDGTTLDDFLKRVSVGHSRLGAQETSNGSVRMGELEGQWFVRTINVGGIAFTSITYSVMRDATVYSVMGITRSDDFGQWEQTFDAVAKSFRFN
ncbi:MAG: hypothetical protein A2X58_05220 [Nitrospirae bacterium GWC2_56_14]|nr:MAG: hypothetical protein A2X58_05220 [Nitrospirae bacterium GWC2_56_14]